MAAFFLACAVFASAQDAAPAVDVSSATRLERVMSVLRARDPRGVAGLASGFASEPRADIRAWMVRGAVHLEPVAGAALAQTALFDPQPIVRMAAVEALAQSRGSAALPDLTAALAAETNAGVRHAIVFWLGSFKTAGALAALSQSLTGDADANVRLGAAQALKRLGTPSAQSRLKAAERDADARVREAARD